MEKLKDKAWLKQKYVDENLTMREIGELLGCTKHPVYRALKKHGLQARAHTSKYPQLNDKEWLRNEYIVKEKSIKQIASEINAEIGTIHSALTHMGIKTRNPKESFAVKYKNGRWGEEASNWRGGRRYTGGHIIIYHPAHPFATQKGNVMEHRLLMEEKIGRYLNPEEVVHHINGIKDDNRIENLQLFANRSEHLKVHFAAVGEVARLKKLLLDNDISPN